MKFNVEKMLLGELKAGDLYITELLTAKDDFDIEEINTSAAFMHAFYNEENNGIPLSLRCDSSCLAGDYNDVVYKVTFIP